MRLKRCLKRGMESYTYQKNQGSTTETMSGKSCAFLVEDPTHLPQCSSERQNVATRLLSQLTFLNLALNS
jgi:hypothetical protein